MNHTAAGIYLNKESNQVVRVGAVPKGPEGGQWMKITDDPNATLLQVRELARQKSLSPQPDEIRWQ